MKRNKTTCMALWTGLGISAALLALWWIADHRRGMAWAISVVNDRFPDAPQLSADELARWLADGARPKPLLADARSENEFGVSHLPGAQRMDPSLTDAEIEERFSKNQPMVLYCAAGYRGSQMVCRLRALGFQDVCNLSGGIFQWANEGRTIHRNGGAVREVHPVSRAFARLLRPEYRLQ